MTGVAALRMYDLDEVRAPIGELWSAVASRLDGAPQMLSWDGEQGAEWRDPDLVLGQTCGWPLINELRDAVTVVGAFVYDIDDAFDDEIDDAFDDAIDGAIDDIDGAVVGAPGFPAYRSVLVATEPRALGSFAGAAAAVNDRDSLSGWVSLGVAVAECAGRGPFFGRLIETGSHRASIEAIRSGAAAIASIDAVSCALFAKHRPALTRGLVVVGHGPIVPTLPLITAARDPEPLRAALEAAVADPATAACRAELLINGFRRLDLSAYEPVAALGRTATDVFGGASS